MLSQCKRSLENGMWSSPCTRGRGPEAQVEAQVEGASGEEEQELKDEEEEQEQ